MIELKKITKAYNVDKIEMVVLKKIDLKVNKGDFLAIMGPSGSGKSTLLNLIGFLDQEYTGEYSLEGEVVISKGDNYLSNLRNQYVGFVFQGFNLVENLTIKENLELPLLYSGHTPRQTTKYVKEILNKLGIGDKEKKYPKQLSGGQQQRVAIARAIITNPSFILADEPTGSLDTVTSKEIMDILKQLNNEGTTIILVTHDPEIISYCGRIVHMNDGVLSEEVSKT